MTNAMTYRGYTASMNFDPQDHIIVGRVEGIDDIVTFHAEGGEGIRAPLPSSGG